MEKSKKINRKDLLIRVVKTFAQAFIGSLTIDGLLDVTDFGTLKTFAVSALTAAAIAGVCAVWNLAQQLLTEKISAGTENKTGTETEETEP